MNLFLHIGAHKTGTTAIQNFCSANKILLRKYDVLYPGEDTDHYHLTYGLDNTFNIHKISSYSKGIIDEINESNCSNVLLSSEGFMENHCIVSSIKHFFNHFLSKYESKIIYYCRKQDDLLESMYKDFIKRAKFNKSFDDFLSLGWPEKYADHLIHLSRFSRFFGKENIIVRVYENGMMNERKLFLDLLSVLDVPISSDFRFPKRKMNIGLSSEYIELKRILNTHILESEGHDPFVEVLEKLNQKKECIYPKILSDKKRKELLKKYEESNKQIAREYLKRNDGLLFPVTEPIQNDSAKIKLGFGTEDILNFIFSLICDQQEKMNDLKREISNLKKFNSKKSIISNKPKNSHIRSYHDNMSLSVIYSPDKYKLASDIIYYEQDNMAKPEVVAEGLLLRTFAKRTHFILNRIPVLLGFPFILNIIFDTTSDSKIRIYWLADDSYDPNDFNKNQSVTFTTIEGENMINFCFPNNFNGFIRIDIFAILEKFIVKEFSLKSIISATK